MLHGKDAKDLQAMNRVAWEGQCGICRTMNHVAWDDATSTGIEYLDMTQ